MTKTRTDPTIRAWLGIDFSGNAAKWRARCTTSNVWIATVTESGDRLGLTDLRRVQDLAGSIDPFGRLAALLARGDFSGAGIDAPFSVPASVAGTRTHANLLTAVGAAKRESNRAFPTAQALLDTLAPRFAAKKTYRRSDNHWRSEGLNVRSTTWSKPRGGAPMTAACMELLARASPPIWPFVPWAAGAVVEAYPAAQLLTWGLPHAAYGRVGDGAEGDRRRAGDASRPRGAHHDTRQQRRRPRRVVCAFAPRAAATDSLVHAIDDQHAADVEGWIAVARREPPRGEPPQTRR